MSYGLCLFRAEAGEGVAEAYARTAGREIDPDEEPKRELDPAIEKLKDDIAAAVVAADPMMKILDFKELAILRGCSVEQARLDQGCIEINERADSQRGIQIMVFDDHVAISIAVRHEGEEAAAVMTDLQRIAAVLRERFGFVLFDPQTNRVIEPDTPIDTGVYTHVVDRFQEDLPPKKPWWQLW